MRLRNLGKAVAGAALGLTLAFTSVTPALAANINVNNAVDGETYTAYKLFEVTSSGDGAYAYSTDSENLVNALEGAKLVSFTKAAASNTWYVDTSETAANKFDAKGVAEFLNNHKEDFNSYGLTPADDDVADKSGASLDLSEGYYFVDSTLGSLCALNTINDKATIDEKNSLPTVTKTVMEDSTGEYGKIATIDGRVDTINYKLTVNTGTGFAGLGNGVDDDYTITDVLPEGIACDPSSVAINGWNKYDEASQTGDYTVTYTSDSRTLTIILKASKLADLGQSEDVEITYTANANSDIETGVEHNNEVTLTYKGHEFKSDASVKTFDLGTTSTGIPAITKVDGNDQTTTLPGVKFVLSKTENGTTKWASFDNNNYLVEWGNQADADELTTDDKGNLHAYGLDAGTYILTETETLPGYNLLNDTITVVIDEDGNETYKLSSTNDEAKDTIEIVNQAGTELPSTGGMGTTALYAVGAVLVVGAGVTLVVRRRAHHEA